MIMINERRNVNMPTMGIPQNPDEFACRVEQFNCWQTKIESYRKTLKDYRYVNNVKINLSWGVDSNWWAELTLARSHGCPGYE